MTNPNNAIGTNGAFGGRTSVNAFNDVLATFSGRGILSGWQIIPSSGMDITIGGSALSRDVAIAEDESGNKTTINNISKEPVTVTIPAAPATNTRYDLIVAYVDNPAQGTSTATDNPAACGLIVVSGNAASSPTEPTDSDIRTAITADGGAGTVAYYVVLGRITVASGTTDITSSMIKAGAYATVSANNIKSTSIDLHDYKTSRVSSLGARAILTIKGGIGVLSVAGDTFSSSGDVYDNIPVTTPFTQELNALVNQDNQAVRVLFATGTNAGTSKISFVPIRGSLTYPAQLYLSGSVAVNL